ncbi:hypothetical protein PIB30_076843 [Stylosanthes scabra]|uniref:Uncharacterized protein n=1 Tax=Stylosanthes scabra TaxID=79078 RepID=A0ABU6XRC0_9FABA|nr:hypothetical protein [Stylosanthes scabra]
MPRRVSQCLGIAKHRLGCMGLWSEMLQNSVSFSSSFLYPFFLRLDPQGWSLGISNNISKFLGDLVHSKEVYKSLVGSDMGPIQPNRGRPLELDRPWLCIRSKVKKTAMEISYNLNRIQGVVPPAYLRVGGKIPYFIRIARDQRDVADFCEFWTSSSPFIIFTFGFACLFPSEEDKSRSSRGRDQDGFGYSDFSSYLFRDYEARLAERIPDISYTRSYAPSEAAYPEQLGFNSYSALPPDDNARMPWSLGTLFRARAAKEEGAKESRESQPTPLSPS